MTERTSSYGRLNILQKEVCEERIRMDSNISQRDPRERRPMLREKWLLLQKECFVREQFQKELSFLDEREEPHFMVSCVIYRQSERILSHFLVIMPAPVVGETTRR